MADDARSAVPPALYPPARLPTLSYHPITVVALDQSLTVPFRVVFGLFMTTVPQSCRTRRRTRFHVPLTFLSS